MPYFSTGLLGFRAEHKGRSVQSARLPGENRHRVEAQPCDKMRSRGRTESAARVCRVKPGGKGAEHEGLRAGAGWGDMGRIAAPGGTGRLAESGAAHGPGGRRDARFG